MKIEICHVFSLNSFKEWALHIPPHITPSIEVSYWNVVVISYALEVSKKKSSNNFSKMKII